MPIINVCLTFTIQVNLSKSANSSPRSAFQPKTEFTHTHRQPCLFQALPYKMASYSTCTDEF